MPIFYHMNHSIIQLHHNFRIHPSLHSEIFTLKNMQVYIFNLSLHITLLIAKVESKSPRDDGCFSNPKIHTHRAFLRLCNYSVFQPLAMNFQSQAHILCLIPLNLLISFMHISLCTCILFISIVHA
jgi:hypothetical protein